MDAVSSRIYLDHAATSWPKSAAAIAAAFDYMQQCGATAGRGGYRSAIDASRWVHMARDNVAKLIGAANGDSIALCHSGTHSLNAALLGLLRPGDHVVTTEMEHNSVLRPLAALQQSGKITVSYVPCDECGVPDIDAARQLLLPATRLFAIGHASNVTGAVVDLAPWRQLATQASALLLVDASQTLGYHPLHSAASGIDVLAAAGHKGLRALAGTGLLYVAPALQSELRPMMWGGTGLASEQEDGGMPWPHSVEVGNLNLPGVVSMAVAAGELLRGGEDSVNVAELAEFSQPWQPLFERLVRGLLDIPTVQLVGYPGLLSKPHVPLVSLRMSGWDVHDLASVLDSQFGIEARSGLHCAARIHTRLQTADGGTLRLSTGHSTTIDDIDRTLAAFREVAGA